MALSYMKDLEAAQVEFMRLAKINKDTKEHRFDMKVLRYYILNTIKK